VDDAGTGGGTAKDVGNMETMKALCSEESGPKCHYASVNVKLGTYNGSICLEAFLVNV